MDKLINKAAEAPGNVAIGDFVAPAQAMRLALREGARGIGRVAPNPLVGCAIVDREHRLLALGHHRQVGYEHAEIAALNNVSDRERLRGARVYVTLEPCAHEGRTGSCAKALAKLPIASLAYAVQDPNPLVAGAGAGILRAAGIDARELAEWPDIEERQELAAEAEELAEVFLFNMRRQAPFVSLKVAATLDGQMGMATGESKWITGEPARARARLLRAGHDATLIGRATLESDDPRLDPRVPGLEGVVNAAVLLDPLGKSFLRLGNAQIAKARPAARVFAVAGPRAPAEAVRHAERAGVVVLRAPTHASGDLIGQFVMPDLLGLLWQSGLRSIFVEGGARTYAGIMRARAAQRLHVFIAPMVLGGATGLAWSRHFGAASLAEGLRLERPKFELLGADLYATGRIAEF
jgi:diaminohydroxyphosphoribosylaminopyrimidine deaminase/5-amino-6-(5-phosphoribosylamino)uracil reductase